MFEHEATTSKISDDQLFYCLQRGLSAEEAMALIVNGFVKDVLQQLPMEFAVEAQKLIAISLEGAWADKGSPRPQAQLRPRSRHRQGASRMSPDGCAPGRREWNVTCLKSRTSSSPIEDKRILNGLDLTVKKGEVAAIMGPNGSGKSTLSYVIAGKEDYEILDGEILLDGENLLEMEPDERAAAGCSSPSSIRSRSPASPR